MRRIEKVQTFLPTKNLEALIVDNPIDLYYLTGLDLSLGRLLIDRKHAYLFVDGRYVEACQKAFEAQDTLSVHLLKTFETWWPYAEKHVGFDKDYTTVGSFENLSKLAGTFVPLKSPIRQIRETKEATEISVLKQAAALGSKGFDYICSSLLKKGVTEEEVARGLEFFWRKQGGERLAFDPHIAFGEGSSQPHYHTSKRSLKEGDVVLIDIGVVVDHYHSDMTRVVFFGEPDLQVKKVYATVFNAYAAALKLCKPGRRIGDLDSQAREMISAAGYGDYFPHSLGHGVGLEIHESPILRSSGVDADRELEIGMVITVEPGIYLPGHFGVRLEDTLVITEEGYENLTNRPLSTTLPIFDLS